MILPGTSASHAVDRIAHIRAALEQSALAGDRGGIISSGIGSATFPQDGESADSLLAVADRRLTADKSRDRRRTTSLEALVRPTLTEIETPSPAHQVPRLRDGVSREELAANRHVWLLFGLLFMTYATIGVSVLRWVPGITGPGFPYVVAFGTMVGIACLVSTPPRIGTARNHAAIAMSYVIPGLCLVTCQPGGSVAIGSAIFIGPLAASRLTSQRQILAHYLVASLVLMAPIPTGLVNPATVLAILLLLVSLWVLGLCCMFVFDATEAQGDELATLALLDPLTGLGNRRRLGETLSALVDAAAPVALLALDLNGFKALNDDHGHAAGDDLLCAVARSLEASAREGDVVVRQGGDEFCIVLPATSRSEADEIGARVRAALAEVRCGDAPLTTGLGVAAYPADAVDAEELMAIADARLIADKRGGERRRAGVAGGDRLAARNAA